MGLSAPFRAAAPRQLGQLEEGVAQQARRRVAAVGNRIERAQIRRNRGMLELERPLQVAAKTGNGGDGHRRFGCDVNGRAPASAQLREHRRFLLT